MKGIIQTMDSYYPSIVLYINDKNSYYKEGIPNSLFDLYAKAVEHIDEVDND